MPYQFIAIPSQPLQWYFKGVKEAWHASAASYVSLLLLHCSVLVHLYPLHLHQTIPITEFSTSLEHWMQLRQVSHLWNQLPALLALSSYRGKISQGIFNVFVMLGTSSLISSNLRHIKIECRAAVITSEINIAGVSLLVNSCLKLMNVLPSIDWLGKQFLPLIVLTIINVSFCFTCHRLVWMGLDTSNSPFGLGLWMTALQNYRPELISCIPNVLWALWSYITAKYHK